MTPPKCPCYCPLCDYPYKYMGKHLQSRHFVKNAKEKRLLTNFATGRVNFRHLSCPVPGCGFSKTRLDRHLEQGHPELDGEKLAELIKGIKRKVTIDSLRALRASDPSPPLVSNLDVGDDEEEMMVDNAEAISDDGVSCSSCQKKSAEITELWRKLRNKERLIKKAKAIIASMSEELRKAKIGPGVESEAEASGGLLPDSEEEDSSAAEEPPKPSDPVLSVLNAYKEFPSSILQYMEQYWVHLKGSMGTRKHIENQKSKVGRVMMFFKFMTEERSVLPNWTFLENIRRIHEWPEHLYGEQKAITTIKLYLVNVLEFLTFFRETPPSTARVSKKSLIAVVRAISCDLRRLAKRVVLRQMQVKKKKVVNLIPKEDLRACQKSARRRIPMLLEALRLLPCPNVKRKFFGYFGAYCASLYGHRTGVLTNMCVGEVDEARAEAELGHDGFVINVKEHKTNKAFGPAQLFLTTEEFGWLEQWLHIRKSFNPSSELVFFNENNQKVMNLQQHLQSAWSEMGLSGSPTFMDIHTSIATYARNVLSPGARGRVSSSMCHNVSTAEKFYAMHQTADQLSELRKTFQLATDPDAPRTSLEETSQLESSSAYEEPAKEVKVPSGQTGPTQSQDSADLSGQTGPTQSQDSADLSGQTGPTQSQDSADLSGQTGPTQSQDSADLSGQTGPTQSQTQSPLQTPRKKKSVFDVPQCSPLLVYRLRRRLARVTPEKRVLRSRTQKVKK